MILSISSATPVHVHAALVPRFPGNSGRDKVNHVFTRKRSSSVSPPGSSAVTRQKRQEHTSTSGRSQARRAVPVTSSICLPVDASGSVYYAATSSDSEARAGTPGISKNASGSTPRKEAIFSISTTSKGGSPRSRAKADLRQIPRGATRSCPFRSRRASSAFIPPTSRAVRDVVELIYDLYPDGDTI